MNNKKVLVKNLIYAFGAQGISLLMSMTVTLIIPKILGITEYSYWQLFIFYIGYVGFFHLGYNDGIYLRLGGMHFSELEHNKIGTQFRIFTIVQFIIAVIIGLLAWGCIKDYNRQVIIIMTGIYLFFNNVALFLGYIFQAVNETRFFSISVIVDRIVSLVLIVLLLFWHTLSFVPYILVYTIGKGSALIYCIYKGRSLVFSKLTSVKEALVDMWISTSVGIKLTISNIMSMLILGIGRAVIDNHWGIEQFGKISFSLSLMNFFLLFIQQVSMVLFPALRRTEGTVQKKVYYILRNLLGLMLPAIFVLYIPLERILSIWLPAYKESFVTLALFLPICIFDGKMQMLCNTYLKVLREEKTLLLINVFSVTLSVVMCVFSAYVLNSMISVVFSMVISIMLRSILAETFLAKKMEVAVKKSIIQEVVIVILFYYIVLGLDNKLVFWFMLVVYTLYIGINKENMKISIKSFNQFLK